MGRIDTTAQDHTGPYNKDHTRSDNKCHTRPSKNQILRYHPSHLPINQVDVTSANRQAPSTRQPQRSAVPELARMGISSLPACAQKREGVFYNEYGFPGPWCSGRPGVEMGCKVLFQHTVLYLCRAGQATTTLCYCTEHSMWDLYLYAAEVLYVVRVHVQYNARFHPGSSSSPQRVPFLLLWESPLFLSSTLPYPRSKARQGPQEGGLCGLNRSRAETHPCCLSFLDRELE